ncbi:hypothetical protein H8N03_13365 [Ramlibacter sp. USB13]|uniref:Uncharacterized protein n=1 Tax=Ramlibacter cellulosilyticus TaxID=2764187 RepID=A0A923SBK5_9BURK|nr:hypothetical protein [Ramlibacter cellulosilyticus]MBC5783939.1 hypothetical protein [Ramlibacter cellulosilyticus]
MDSLPLPPKPQRFKLGAPQRVLVLVDPPALTLRMADVVRSIPGLQLAGFFHNATDAIEWTVWDRGGWHYAFVDLALPEKASQDVISRLLSQPKPGTVVALGPHLWKEIRQECATMGVYHLLEKGDIVAFRGFLEELVR